MLKNNNMRHFSRGRESDMKNETMKIQSIITSANDTPPHCPLPFSPSVQLRRTSIKNAKNGYDPYLGIGNCQSSEDADRDKEETLPIMSFNVKPFWTSRGEGRDWILLKVVAKIKSVFNYKKMDR